MDGLHVLKRMSGQNTPSEERLSGEGVEIDANPELLLLWLSSFIVRAINPVSSACGW